MRYTIEGFSQAEAIKFRRTEIVKRKKQRTGEYEEKETVVTLDCSDLLILRWFVDFYPKMIKVEIGGVQYAWVSYKDIIKDMPLLGFKKGMVALRLKKMVSFGILAHKTVKKDGTFSYYGFGPNYARLVDDEHTQENAEGTQKIVDPLSKKLDTPQQKISDQIDSSTKDSSTKDNQKKEEIPFAEIIDYLNEKTGKHFRSTTADYQREIHARWVDENKPDVSEFVAKCRYVIDVKCAEWLGTDFEKNLNPKTLFRAANFDRYANQPMPKQKSGQTDRRSQYTEEQNQEFDLYSWDADQITYL